MAGSIIAAALLSGCAAFSPRPIDAPTVEGEFRSRTLADPELREYLETNLPSNPSAVPPPAWDLSTLTLVAFYYHPDLDVARAQVTLAAAGVRTAAGRPNPSIGVSPGFATNSPAGFSPWILEFTFDVPVETAGKRRYRVARAERVTDAARLELARVAWQVRSRVRAALLDHLLAARDLDLLHAAVAIRSDVVAVMERRLEVGDVSRPDAVTAQTELATASLAERVAERRVAETRVALASALGLRVSALDAVTLVWPELDRPPSADQLSPDRAQRAGLLNRLDVRRALAEYGAVEAALQLEVAKQYPDVHVGPGYLWDQGENKFLLGLSITLPLFNQNQGPIAEAEARRAEAAARFLALQSRVIEEMDATLARYRGALVELAAADRTLVLLQAQESAVQQGLELGEEDRLALVGVQIRRAVAARQRLAALQTTQQALGALEDAVQQPLDASGPVPPLPPSSPREPKAGGRPS